MERQPGRSGEAERLYSAAIAAADTLAVPYANLGALAQKDPARYEEAEAAFRAALERDPKLSQAWEGLALSLTDTGRSEEALRTLRTAVATLPDDPHLANALAWFLFVANEDADEAEAQARRASRAQPDNAWVLHTLSCVLARSGSWVEAANVARRWLTSGDEELFENSWDEIVEFFRTAGVAGRASEALELLESSPMGQAWRPLVEAMATVVAGTRKHLRRVAPEIRSAAAQLVDRLDPEGNVAADPRDSVAT